MHGSPYDYDTHVPIIIKKPHDHNFRIVNDQVTPESIVATLADFIKVNIPDGANKLKLK